MTPTFYTSFLLLTHTQSINLLKRKENPTYLKTRKSISCPYVIAIDILNNKIIIFINSQQTSFLGMLRHVEQTCDLMYMFDFFVHPGLAPCKMLTCISRKFMV